MLSTSFEQELKNRRRYYRQIGKPENDFDFCSLPNDVLEKRYPLIRSVALRFAILRTVITRIILSNQFTDFLDTVKRYPIKMSYMNGDFNYDLCFVYKREFSHKIADGSFFRDQGILKEISMSN